MTKKLAIENAEGKKSFSLTRRSALAALGGTSLALLGSRASAQTALPQGASANFVETHGLSTFGDLKYPITFQNFEYVNPNAPIGGTLSHVPGSIFFNQNFNTFNSMNSFILRGDGPIQMEIIFASLMVRAYDEPDAMYGLAAKSVRHDKTHKTFQFLLRPEAKFHDGTQLTAEDVEYSINILKTDGHPLISGALTHIEKVSVDAPDAITVKLKPDAPRDVILSVAALPIFSKAYYAKVPFNEVTMQPPLGSGPYKVGKFEQGRYFEYERVSDWWGWNLPSMKGNFNWAKMRIEYYRDRDVAFEAFKSGEYLVREEFTSRLWATAYTFPAFTAGKVKKETLPDGRPSGMQGFFLNMRREKFKDVRVRQAMGLAFDFEWSNKSLFFDSYVRTQSVFQNSPYMAQGLPSPEELAILEPMRDRLSPEVFGEAIVQPQSDATGSDRVLLRRAGELLKAAGCKIEDGKVFLPNGERFTVELLEFDPGFERVLLPYIKNLQAIGIEAKIRMVDAAQYQVRSNDFDFDMTNRRYGFESTPGDSLRRMFSSRDAKLPGSYNLSGLADPVIDDLIERVVQANDRTTLTIACKVLDRVLRSTCFWIPQWSKPYHNLAYWDVYDHPNIKPPYARAIVETWWINESRAKAIGKGL